MATIYLNKKNLFYNLDKISQVNPNILAVIKDNAYGHGIITFSKMLREYGIKKVCLRNNFEAELVKDIFEEVIIFYPGTNRNAKNISYSINSLIQLKKNRHPYIHLKIDTGMHRNGILMEELEEALEIIKKKELELRGVFSHFCCADETTPDTFIQYKRFEEVRNRVIEFCKKNNLNIPYFHLANSEALLKLPKTFDYVRPGIAMYGGIDGFKPVMKLVAKTISKRKITSLQGVGYNKKFISSKDMTVSTVDVGYGDGIPYFTNGCELKETQALGKISMDSMIVEGDFDEVIIFDDVKEFVKNFNTITYDILVKMSPKIKRIIN
ncbi:alanine racemase [Lebetimonas natsushimae]|uniref:Alanine racemase n=1 Tax=Lebetimonas natsushimae TaxID=1936991 RepID=A0A292YFE4_9BACT|nr:alanine racemase [Lebetimonas natsushimae]GAX87889.1 alanine racemase [Lebetimonas natsushimae]